MRPLLLLSISLLLVSCQPTETDSDSPERAEAEQTRFGQVFTPDEYVSVAALLPTITSEESQPVQVRGEVVQVCQSKGCWLTLATDGDIMVRVTFKDYEFFVPKDIAGREVLLEGITWLDEVSKDHQQHYAEDAGEAKETMESIQETKLSYYFEASGVILL